MRGSAKASGPASRRAPRSACRSAAMETLLSENRSSSRCAPYVRLACRPTRKERLGFRHNFINDARRGRSVTDDTDAFAGRHHDHIEVLPRSGIRVGGSEAAERRCGLRFAVRPLLGELVDPDAEGEFLWP